LLSLLIPHLNSAATKNAGSNTVTTALTQRAHLLQEENDELYELLKHSETGKLKDEVRGLRRAVAKLENALTGTLSFPETRFSYAEKVSRPSQQNLTK
jgi:WTAP/Mum2p family